MGVSGPNPWCAVGARSSFSPQTSVNRRDSQTPGVSHASEKQRVLQAVCDRGPSPTFCLPCRRSRVRIPSAALEKACVCRSFSLLQSPCASVSGRTDSGLAARRSSAASRKNARFAGRFWFVRTEVILRACRRSGVRPAAAVPPTPAVTARSRGQRPPARYQRSRPWGQSGFSPETAGQPRPAPRPRRAMAPEP